MRILLQRTKWARVKARDQDTVGIGQGIMALIGFAPEDESLPGTRVWDVMRDKVLNLRIFPDEQKPMNQSVMDVKGEVLLVPQFTLYGDCSKGRRPGFSGSAPGELAGDLFQSFTEHVRSSWDQVFAGYFGAEMEVELCNWGPVTFMLDSRDYS